MSLKKLTRQYLTKIARKEVAAWKPSLNRGLVIAVLYAYIEHVLNGYPIDEKGQPQDDYQI